MAARGVYMGYEPFDLSRARVCAIVNVGSGKKSGHDIADTLQKRLQGHVGSLEIRRTENGASLPDIARHAAADEFDLVLAVGGDGTQSAVAGALAGTGIAMGVIPGGTFNYFARDLGVGETVDAAIETVLAGRAQAIDIGDLNGMVFLNNVSFGAYPEILRQREDIYRRWGRSRIAAYWSVILSLLKLRQPMRLTARTERGERAFTTALVFAAKSAYQLETLGIDGAEAIRRGELALLVARPHRPRGLVLAALRLALGKSTRGDDFELVCADDITIVTGRRHQLVAHDGEKTRMSGPFHLRVRHGDLTVLVPEAE